MSKIKKYNDYLNEDFDQSVENMKSSSDVYNKYKNRVSTMINPESSEESSDEFEKFLETLPDDEKEASDLLRSLFNSEMMAVKIELLEKQKKDIEEELKQRIDDLKELQNRLP